VHNFHHTYTSSEQSDDNTKGKQLMSKTDLEKSIAEAASVFAQAVVSFIKESTLQELTNLQTETTPRRGRQPSKAATTTKSGKVREKPGPKPGQKKSKVAVKTKKATSKKKSNYPKCAFPGCDKNRFARGQGFCGEHWKERQEGKIMSAEEYGK
jgi:hypothetical protein